MSDGRSTIVVVVQLCCVSFHRDWAVFDGTTLLACFHYGEDTLKVVVFRVFFLPLSLATVSVVGLLTSCACGNALGGVACVQQMVTFSSGSRQVRGHRYSNSTDRSSSRRIIRCDVLWYIEWERLLACFARTPVTRNGADNENRRYWFAHPRILLS